MRTALSIGSSFEMHDCKGVERARAGAEQGKRGQRNIEHN